MQELIQQLPFASDSFGLAHKISEASCTLPAHDLTILQQSATGLGIRLEQQIAAGFSALLSRLLWHESISIVQVAAPPCLLTCAWEAGSPFRTVVARMHMEPLNGHASEADNGASFQFLSPDPDFHPSPTAALRLTAGITPEGSLHVHLGSAAGRWSSEILESWLSSLVTLWLAAATTPDLPLRQLPLLAPDALTKLYAPLNQTTTSFPSIESGLSAPQVISRQSASAPSAIAVRHNGRQLIYAELEDLSSRWARRLITLGAGLDRPIAICMERTELLPVAILAILKSGSCYVPLDPHHPSQRLTSILEECRPIAVLSDQGTAQWLKDAAACPVLCMDEPCEDVSPKITLASPAPGDLAYIIYTSGTTGKPKGVQITHVALLNLLEAMQRRPGISSADRWLAVATISFDIATMDMLLPLFSGATLVISSRHAGGDPFELSSLIAQENVTVMQATPFTLKLLANSDWSGKPGLKVVAGGEALPRDLANQLNALGCELWNCYGPTETTIYSSAIRIESGEGIVPIGGPVDNTSFYVMDEAGHLVPPGVPGELYIGGMGVSRGYLDRPELTAQRFLPDPLATEPNARCFRTGDLVRYLHPGQLQFMGRLDHQVKLRGFRIELAEIESVLRTHPIVADAAVILREDVPGEQHLVAYFTQAPSVDAEAATADLRAYSSRLLPEYMLPSLVVRLDQMPLTGSGKVDRKALPAPETMPSQVAEPNRTAAAGVEPSSPLEAQLLAIFREVLGNASIGVTDSFFDYGGYSLLTARLFSRIHRTLGRRLPISMLFDGPTPRRLAALMEEGAQPSIIVPIRATGTAAPLFVVHSYLIYAVLLEAIEPHRPIYGIRELDDAHVGIPLEERAALYCSEIMKTCPTGPIHIAGWCAAGSLTVEVARLLRERGRAVTTVALFDAERPGWTSEIAKDSNLLKTKVQSFQTFHRDRMRGLSFDGKLAYLYEQWARRWEDGIEAVASQHRTVFSWVQQHAPFLLPEALRYGSTGVAPENLRPANRQFYPGKITLFRAMDVAEVSDTEPSLGWDAVAGNGVDVEFAPGDHESMFRPPQVDQFGSILRRVLREGEATPNA